jgi:Kef-type K+ transport system membrane component KefB
LCPFPALIAAPFAFVLLLLVKMLTKFVGVFPMTKAYRSPPKESMYTTLLMSTRAHLRHHLHRPFPGARSS